MLKILKQGLAVAVFLAPVIVVAQPPGGPAGQGFGPGHGPGRQRGGPSEFGPHGFRGGMDAHGFGDDLWNRPELQQRLGLSEEQVARLQQSRLEFETKRIDTHAKTEIARLNLENLLKRKDVDKAAVDGLIDQLGELHKENLRGMVHQKIALGEILDATQLQKVEAFLDRSRERFERPGFQDRMQDLKERRSGRMERDKENANKEGKESKKGSEKKDRKADPDKVGFVPPGDRPFGPPPGGPGAGFGGPQGRGRRGPGGPGGPGMRGPHGPGFGPPPPFPPSEFGAPPEGLSPPPEDFTIDLGEPLENAVEPPQE